MTNPSSRRGPDANRTSSKRRSDQAATAAQVTELLGDPATPGVLVALAALEGVRENRRPGSWVALCPVHGDGNTPNLCVDVTTNMHGLLAVQFRCVSCGANGDAVLASLGLSAHAQVIYHRGKDAFAYQRPKYAAPLPSVQQLNEWRSALRADEERWRYVTEVRGVATKTAHRFRLGWDAVRKRYTLPVTGKDGLLANVRLYNPDAEPPQGKMTHTTGHGAARLYPAPPRSDTARGVVVTEGEWDALVARSHGLVAVSGTNGAGMWLPEWSAALAGRPVAFVYDCDEAGRTGAAKAAASVARFAESVRVVDLGLADKEDLTDWFVKHGKSERELRALIMATPTAGAGEWGGPHV